MADTPARAPTRSPGWIAAVGAVVATLAFVYYPLMAYSVNEWITKPDYSHGFLVPLFAGYLAWTRRDLAPPRDRVLWPDPRGLGFLLGGVLLFLTAGRLNIGQEWLQGLSLVLNLCGTALLLGGARSLNWLWPSAAFLLFMFPLPFKVEHFLSWPLQKVAATWAEFVLQTIGYPTYREGVILHVQDHVLEVEKACNGLSMLLTFVTLSAAVALVVRRPWIDRALILASAVPIAIVSNVIRIAVTGVLYNEAGRELGDRVFHDFAGWMMMPLALGVMWLGLKLLDWVFREELVAASREDVIKMTKQPAHLFMTALTGMGTSRSDPPAKASAPTAAGNPPAGSGR